MNGGKKEDLTSIDSKVPNANGVVERCRHEGVVDGGHAEGDDGGGVALEVAEAAIVVEGEVAQGFGLGERGGAEHGGGVVREANAVGAVFGMVGHLGEAILLVAEKSEQEISFSREQRGRRRGKILSNK